MGVPKLFRWLSERYPCLSEKVQEWQIPEFDNLYLDMNGIIHNCSHPNDDDIQFRISEEQIFKDIFNYIDFLFKTIKPKKVFYMAIDGVAPRAKMNQQRSRRFRTAKEAYDKEQEAIKKGKVLPKEQRFDSNCITPGTDFMIRLQEQLKYFVIKKISTDDLWKNVKVHLSGHEAPGEGEHKIMDFIRYMRSQPDYDPYTRHCLYGLDADLIMLGIVTHEPYFSLLREEVKYVKVKSKDKKPTGPENINFHLFHLTILRDYLETEFSKIKENHSSLFNLEKIIDDWVFLCILVGNDFIPHLPHYHINKNSLIVLYETYMELLPHLNGYINEGGILNLERLELFFEKLGEVEIEKFNENNQEFQVFDKQPSKFFKEDRHLANFFDDNDEVKEENLESESDESDNYFSDTENCFLTNNEFELHKYNYYKKKLNFHNITEEIIREHALSYVEALQWNLLYYFEGCCSWTWYYPHHYAPYVSDIKNFKNVKIKFDKDKPLLPYEQLLGVLPIASKRFLPESFQQIMISKDSPLVGCYPTDFKLDYNGKAQQWEAVVLIPFIQEELLKKASSIAKKGLSDDEKKHNVHGPHLMFTYTDIPQPLYESSLPHIFPAIANNRAKCIEIPSSKYNIPSDKINKGISKKIKLQTHFFGFPSLKFLKYKSEIKNEKIKVFDTLSKGNNVILYLEKNCDNDVSNLAQYLEKNIYFNWPYPKECKLKSYFDGEFLYSIKKDVVIKKKLESRETNMYFEKIKSLENFLLEKKGIKIMIETGLCIVEPVIGYYMKVNDDGTIVREKQYSTSQVLVLARTLMPKLKLKVAKTNDIEKAVDIFKPGNKCFLLDKTYYGDMGEIISYNHLENKVKVRVMISDEPDLSDVMEREEEILFDNYKSSTQIARLLNVSSLSISKITGCVFVNVNKKKNVKVNIGLNLKFNEKNQQMANYSKKMNDLWFFSNKVFEIIYEYLEKFPSVIEQIIKYKKFDELEVKDIFPYGNAEAQFKELMVFLKNLPFSKDKRQNIDDDILDECIVNVIEETLQSSIMLLEDSKPKIVETDVKNIFVSLPFLSKTHPDPAAEFGIFNRVVNVKQGIIVPQGLKGIVIGIEEKLEEDKNSLITVVFDEVFEGGLCINTKQNRCYVLPQSYLMNISFGKYKKCKNKENLLDCILPPVKSKHFQKETYTAPKHKVENPFYDESKNYWAKLSLKEQQKSKKIQNGSNNKSPFSIKQDKNKQENGIYNKNKKNEKSPTKEQKFFKVKPEYTILKNENGFKNREALKEDLNLNNELDAKIKNYFSKKLNYYCQEKYKSKPRIIFTKGINKSSVQIHVPKPNETVTYYQDFDVKVEKEESYEEICKLALSKLKLSTILPPTFILNNDNCLAKNFELPSPPKSWIN